jgi:hypothetical protein
MENRCAFCGSLRPHGYCEACGKEKTMDKWAELESRIRKNLDRKRKQMKEETDKTKRMHIFRRMTGLYWVLFQMNKLQEEENSE